MDQLGCRPVVLRSAAAMLKVDEWPGGGNGHRREAASRVTCQRGERLEREVTPPRSEADDLLEDLTNVAAYVHTVVIRAQNTPENLSEGLIVPAGRVGENVHVCLLEVHVEHEGYVRGPASAGPLQERCND